MIGMTLDLKRNEQRQLKKYIKEGKFEKVYNYLVDNNCDFSYSYINAVFGSNDSKNKFLFMLYVIAKAPDVKKYETLLNILMFEDPFLDNYECLVRKFALEGIEMFPDETDIQELILFMYDDSPSELFSKEELEIYREYIREKHGELMLEGQLYIKDIEDDSYRGIERNNWLPFSIQKKGNISKTIMDNWFDECCKLDFYNVEGMDVGTLFRKIKPFYVKIRSAGAECELIFTSKKFVEKLGTYDLQFLGIEVMYDGDHSLCVTRKDSLKEFLGKNGLCNTLEDFKKARKVAAEFEDAGDIIPLYVYKVLIPEAEAT